MCDVIRKSENVSFDWPSSRGAFDNLTAIRSPYNRRLDMPTTALLAGHVTQQQVLVYFGNAASFSCSFAVLHRATRRRRLRQGDDSDGDEQRSIQRQRQKYAVSADIYVSGILPRRRHFISQRDVRNVDDVIAAHLLQVRTASRKERTNLFAFMENKF